MNEEIVKSTKIQ